MTLTARAHVVHHYVRQAELALGTLRRHTGVKVKQAAEGDMRIGALSRQTGVSARLLRYYEEQELLRPLRLANGYGEYSESDIAAVRHIRVLLAAGLPTTVIARLLDCVHDDGVQLRPAFCPGMIASLQDERRRISDIITQLQASAASSTPCSSLPASRVTIPDEAALPLARLAGQRDVPGRIRPRTQGHPTLGCPSRSAEPPS
jgi:DNA-binding transcriptional MerR regulator